MDEKLKSTIDKIVQLSKQNPEFDAELRKRLEITSSAKSVYDEERIVRIEKYLGLDFYVDENVLIPQPDTEILVEEVLKIADNIKKSNTHNATIKFVKTTEKRNELSDETVDEKNTSKIRKNNNEMQLLIVK